jgi:hypothetical protein
MFLARIVASYRMVAMITFIVSVTLCAVTVLLLITWTVPVLDDFCRAYYQITVTPSQPSGIINAIINTYLGWTGRWAGAGLELLVLSAAKLPGDYPWLVFTLTIIQCLILYLAIWNFTKNVRSALFFSALIASVYWATMPSPQESIFWFTGAVENQFQLVFIPVLFSFALSAPPTGKTRSTSFPTIAASGLGFVTPAFHELVGGALVVALSAITARAFLYRSSDRKVWLTIWSVSTLGFLMVFAAPGNFVRLSNTGNFSVLAVISETSRAIYHYILPWFLNFKHWLLAIVVWFDPRVGEIRAKFPGMSSLRSIGISALIWLSSIMIMLIFTISIGSQPPPERTMNLIYGVFLIGWITLAFLLRSPHPRLPVYSDHRVTTLSLALFLVSMLVATSNHTVDGILDLVSGAARSWNTEMNRRYAVLRAAGRDADVVFPPIAVHPRILVPLLWIMDNPDFVEDPKFFGNHCLSKYFDVASVRISALPKQ